MVKAIAIGLLVAATSIAQVNFDVQTPSCNYTPPTPCGAFGDAENVSWNGSAAGASPTLWVNHPTVDTVSGAGMPASGTGYLRNSAARPTTVGGTTIPLGGPIPAAYDASDVYILLPTGTTSISFSWDFYSMEGAASGSFNDAGSIELVASCGGPALATLVYADTYTASVPLVSMGCVFSTAYGPVETAPAGPQSVVSAAVPAGSNYLRIRCANSADNSYPSQMVIDNVVWFPPAPIPPAPCRLYFSSPAGPGSVKMDHTPCAPVAGANYFMTYRLATPGLTPNGFWFGLDIGFPDILNIFYAGYPFTGLLDGSGSASFGPVGGLPSGLPFWAVSSIWAPGYANFLISYPIVNYTIP